MKKNYRPLAILEHEIESLVLAETKALEAKSTGLDIPESDLLSVHEGVGVIEVNGQLTNKNSYWNSLFGLVSYDEVRTACVEAVELGVDTLLFDIDSPGGTVSGMSSISQFIKGLEIPTIAYSGGQIASAAYFLGVSADHIFVDNMAEAGSIGVVLRLQDATEAYKKAGIKPITIRSGSKKAIGGSSEKLSPDNHKYLQGQVDTFADQFFSFVSESRGIPRPAMTEIEEGGTYIGSEGVIAGLVDGVKSFDETLIYAMDLALKQREKREQSDNHYRRGYNVNMAQEDITMPKSISRTALSALVTADAAREQLPDAEAAAEEQTPELTPEELAVQAADMESSNDDNDDNPAMVEASELVVMTEKFDASQVELAGLTEKLEASQSELTDLKEKHTKELSTYNSIITGQINTMRVALSLSVVDMSTWTSEAVLVEYEAVGKTFEASLPVGGVVPQDEDKRTPEAHTREDENNIKNLGF